MNRTKAGRIRKAAAAKRSCWRSSQYDPTTDRTIVTKVFIDSINEVTKENQRALIQTQVFNGQYWDPKFSIISDKTKEVAISTALQWCEENEGKTTGLEGEKPTDWRKLQPSTAA